MWWQNRNKTLAEGSTPSGQALAHNGEKANGFRGRFSERDSRAQFGTITNEVPRSLLAKVYALLAFSLAATAAGGLLGYRLDPVWVFLTLPVALGLIFLIDRLREVDGWNVVLLYTFCLLNGLLIGAVLAGFVGAGMTDIVLQAGVATVAVTVAMSFIGLTVKQDLTVWGSFLYTALIGLVGAFIANIFIGQSIISLVASAFAVGVFSLFLIFDTNRIRRTPDTMGNAVMITLDIYLDIVNLFLNLLNLLAELSEDD
jgi:FtsH-binding integral membrane protein